MGSRITRCTALAIATVASFALVGCGEDRTTQPPANYPETSSATLPSNPTATPTPQPAVTEPQPQPAAPPSPATPPHDQAAGGKGSVSSLVALSDDEIVAVTVAMNTGEVEQAKLAVIRASTPAVKKFAEHVSKDHTAMAKDQDSLATKINVTPRQNMLSMKVQSDGQQTLDTLKGAKGTQFDREYISAQVTAHKEAIEILDTKLIPNVKNSDLKAKLQEARTKLDAHLKEAEKLLASLPQ